MQMIRVNTLVICTIIRGLVLPPGGVIIQNTKVRRVSDGQWNPVS